MQNLAKRLLERNNRTKKFTTPPSSRASKADEPRDTDGLPIYTRDKLVKMNRAFVSAVERAIELGFEQIHLGIERGGRS